MTWRKTFAGSREEPAEWESNNEVECERCGVTLDADDDNVTEVENKFYCETCTPKCDGCGDALEDKDSIDRKHCDECWSELSEDERAELSEDDERGSL